MSSSLILAFFRAKQRRNQTGYYKPTNTGDNKFNLAWLHHVNHNKHHWQYWTRVQDDGSVVAYPIGTVSIVEMICDWIGAAKAHGAKIESGKEMERPGEFYEANKDKMVLHEETRFGLEWILSIGRMDKCTAGVLQYGIEYFNFKPKS